jgi:TP901 family phage tail tape measure protein
MKELGINVLDSQGKLRDMGSIIEQIGNNWQSLTREQQQSLAITAAGTRQYNNLLSLFNNWDMYQAALKTSENAAGTLASQQEIYLESLEAKTEKLTAATEELYLNLFDSDSFKDVIDLFTKVIEQVAMFTDAIGGGGNALLMLGSIATNVWGD